MNEQDEPKTHAPETERDLSNEAIPPENTDAEVERKIRQMSRRSLLWGAVAIASGYGSWRWLITRRPDEGVPWPLRRSLEVNEQLARDYFQPSRLAPTFPRGRAGTPRENGDEGLSEEFDPAIWSLYVVGAKDTEHATATDPATGESALKLSLAQIRALPRVEIVTELKCIEGWSQVVHWAGARFADFAARYPPAPREDTEEEDKPDNPANWPGYVSLVTPDAGYYVGLDMASAMHPQTLLCYEMNGKLLELAHGAPLRLVIPVKYGIKHLKRIGTIQYTDHRPADYWAERGYDWYAGH